MSFNWLTYICFLLLAIAIGLVWHWRRKKHTHFGADERKHQVLRKLRDAEQNAPPAGSEHIQPAPEHHVRTNGD